jgi:hypothetical protein
MRQNGSLSLRVFLRFLMGVLLLAALAYPASRVGLFDWPRAWDPLALPDLDANPNILTGWQLRLAEVDSEGCAVALRRAGLSAAILPEKVEGTSCGISGGVMLTRLSAAKLRPEETRCVIAARLYLWERTVLQPAAQRLFHQPVAEVLHFGSYSCRTMRGRSAMSEHARANAFDISGFRLANGQVISVKQDWRKPTPAGQLLNTAHSGLCGWFNVTLSPDYNADHADHFHVDMGWWKTCR